MTEHRDNRRVVDCTCGMTTLHLKSRDLWEPVVTENALRSAQRISTPKESHE